ncbi:tetratricopeptide repeat protein [Streptomyces spinosisporus]|uniref:Tetratricopeptide repeat protein n=1 Tax=Streptomyces spinosisporus TaxID=2927582 RepID=A0ABS9XQN1_9ACTN|nr:tetratricopeptide repeat protein [Streptomyces spinosisporus]MCI3243636.1 tetratricopeptide repeat protein [Streptomyces spinosisporus]
MAPRTNGTEPERKQGPAPATPPNHEATPHPEKPRHDPALAKKNPPPGPDGPDQAGSCAVSAGSGETDLSTEVGPGANADPRVAAVRRVRALQLGGTAVLLAVALTAGSIAVGALRDHEDTTVAAASGAVSPAVLSGGLDASIAALQAQLRVQPKDFGSWATLGLAYVEQARTKGDPSRYPQAQKALKRSLELKPGNEQAVTGQAALAAARHDFTDALRYADGVLKENPYSERALSSRIDALVELGRYADASRAADTADSRRPGVPVFTRYAYVHELRGDVKTARRVLEQALGSSTARGDISYVAAQLGQLAWNQGDYKSALTHYARALAADENYLPALQGRALAQYASGDRAAAIKGMEQVVARYPLPQPLVELGEMYEERGAEGDRAKALDQYALVDAWIALARANGVNADLDTALAAADHGDRTSALRAARAEWTRRHTVHTADALAWALHVNGQDTQALSYARQATATGYRNASFLYHRGMIERATGHPEDARASLKAALKLNPGFSPLGAHEAREAIKDLEAAQ